MTMTAIDLFKDWKKQEVTKGIYQALQFRKQTLLEELETEAGKDPLSDRYRAGYIAACNDILNATVEEIEIQEIE